jgi:hypothetical protein
VLARSYETRTVVSEVKDVVLRTQEREFVITEIIIVGKHVPNAFDLETA